MSAEQIEALVRLGLAIWLAVSVFRWMLGQLGVALCGYRKNISELSWFVVVPLFVVFPQLLFLFGLGLLVASVEPREKMSPV